MILRKLISLALTFGLLVQSTAWSSQAPSPAVSTGLLRSYFFQDQALATHPMWQHTVHVQEAFRMRRLAAVSRVRQHVEAFREYLHSPYFAMMLIMPILGIAMMPVGGQPATSEDWSSREINSESMRAWLESVKARPWQSVHPGFERRLQEHLQAGGEPALEEFGALYETVFGQPLQYRVPPIKGEELPASSLGQSLSEYGHSYDIPWSQEHYDAERLRLMSQIALQKAMGRKIMVNIGIGFVGTANLLACSNAHDGGHYPYFALGYQRPSTHSSWKVDAMQRGLPTIKTDDEKVVSITQDGRDRGNLGATFLRDQALAIADVIFVETELHARKPVPRAIERGTADPEETLELISHIASVMPAHATVVVESTVYPGFSFYDALPRMNEALQKRGILKPGQDANLAYGFHRLKPGAKLMDSFFSIERSGAGATPQARQTLRDYYRTTGIRYRLWSDLTTVEFMKDVENAATFGVLDLMAAFLKAAEESGINAWKVIAGIIRARPREHGGYVRFAPGLQVGGYCVPKELVLLIQGLQRHFGLKELDIQAIFNSRLVAAATSDHRAEDAVAIVTRALAGQGKKVSESTILWAGVSYKEGVADTRMAGTERGLRYASHYGAKNRATDPAVMTWPQIQNQRLGDPESWGHGLQNQEVLRDLQIENADHIVDVMKPEDDVLVLAVRHASYMGQAKPQKTRTGRDSASSAEKVFKGLDPIQLTARIGALEGKIVFDAHDLLDDKDIKKFLAMGWDVRGFGKGHISQLRSKISLQQELEWNRELLRELGALSPGSPNSAIVTVRAKIAWLEARQRRATAQDRLKAEVAWKLAKASQELPLSVPSQRDLNRLRVETYSAYLNYLEGNTQEDDAMRQKLETLQDAEASHQRDIVANLQRTLVEPELTQSLSLMARVAHLLQAVVTTGLVLSGVESGILDIYRALRHLRYARLSPLLQDLDRLIELLPEDSKREIFRQLRRIEDRSDLAVYDPSVEGDIYHPLFNEPQAGEEKSFQEQAPGTRLLPATVFAQGADGKLKKLEDPQKHPNRFTTKWVPDHAAALSDKDAFPQEWSKFSVEVPLNLVKVDPSALRSDGSVDVEYYEDFMYLPAEFREWVVNEVFSKGYTLSTLAGEPQDKIVLLMDVNLDSKTIARGRGGVVLWKDTRQPVIMSTPEGIEIPLDLKGMGDFRGADDPKTNLTTQRGRQVISGRGTGGGTNNTNLGQTRGHMVSADDTIWQERQKTMGRPTLAPRTIFRVRWKYEGQIHPQPFQMVGRGSPSEMRLGNGFFGTEDWDTAPAESSRILGRNNAVVIGHDIAAVHIALNLDNVMAHPERPQDDYYTDMGSNIDLFTERNPRATMFDYLGYGAIMAIYTYADLKKSVADSSFVLTEHREYLQPWFDGFLDTFFALDHGRRLPAAVKQRFEKYRNIESIIRNPEEMRAALEARGVDLARFDNRPAEMVIEWWLWEMWENYVAYQVLKNRLARGYDYTVESPYTQSRDPEKYDSSDPERALAYLDYQKEVLELARKAQALGYPALTRISYDKALAEIEIKKGLVLEKQGRGDEDYSAIYDLRFYRPLSQDIITVIDPKTAARSYNGAPWPTAFLNKEDGNQSKRIATAALRVEKMSQRSGEQKPLTTLQAYFSAWKHPQEGSVPEEADLKTQQTAEKVLALVRSDFRNVAVDPNLKAFGDVRWGESRREGAILYASFFYHQTPEDVTYIAIYDDGRVLEIIEARSALVRFLDHQGILGKVLIVLLAMGGVTAIHETGHILLSSKKSRARAAWQDVVLHGRVQNAQGWAWLGGPLFNGIALALLSFINVTLLHGTFSASPFGASVSALISLLMFGHGAALAAEFLPNGDLTHFVRQPAFRTAA